VIPLVAYGGRFSRYSRSLTCTINLQTSLSPFAFFQDKEPLSTNYVTPLLSTDTASYSFRCGLVRLQVLKLSVKVITILKSSHNAALNGTGVRGTDPLQVRS
jgi:hypothetical protein